MAGGDCLQILSRYPSTIYNRYAKYPTRVRHMMQRNARCAMFWECFVFFGGLAAWQGQTRQTKTIYFLRVRAREGPPGGGGYRSSNTDSNLYIWELPIWAKTVPLHTYQNSMYISRRVVPSFYIRIRKMSSLKIFLLDNYLTHTHNRGVGSLTN